MKKHYYLLMLSLMLALSSYAQTPVITSVVDACGSDGKFVELYVSGTVDMADYKLVRRSNANPWSNGVDIDLSALGSRTDEFVYVGRDIPTLETEFPSAGISTSNAIEDGSISHNGDDSYRLVEVAGDVVIDQFGGDIDGSGEPWEYGDSWVARNDGEGPNTTFTLSEWSFGTIDDLNAVGLCNDPGNPTLETVATSVGTYVPPASSNAGVDCSDPIVINALPFSTSDNTANYGDEYDNGSSDCSGFYMSGDDVVYSFTPSSDGNYNFLLSNLSDTWSGLHVMEGCIDDTPVCVGFEGNSNSNDRELDIDLTGGVTYYVVVATWAAPQSTSYDLDISENSCTDATVNYTVVNDCDNSGGFLIDVEVTDMGSANSLTVSNDQNANTIPVTNPSTVQVGPFTNGTDVVVTVVDDDDANCTLTSSALTQEACPPENDNCPEALPLSITSSNTNVTSLSTVAATETPLEIVDCDAFGNSGVWYTFTAPASNLEFESITGSPGITIFEGPDCDNLTELTGNCINNDSGSISGLTQGNDYYAMVWTDSGEASVEFSLYFIDCQEPTNLDAQNITTSSADLTWTAGDAETEWEVVWGDVNFDPLTEGTTVADDDGTLGVSLSGLNSGTPYEYYVKAICSGSSESNLAGPFAFSTLCDVVSAPLSENFDGSNFTPNPSGTFTYDQDALDPCFSRSPANDGDTFTWMAITGETGSASTGPSDDVSVGGNYMYTEASEGDAGDEAFLNLPQLDLSSLTNPFLTFFYHMFGDDMGTLSVEVKDVSDTSYNEVFSISGEQQSGNADAFIEQFVDLSAFSGQTVDIRFKAVRGPNFNSDIAIDEISVDEAPSCIKPQNLTTSNITPDSADLTWDEEPLSTATDGYQWLIMAEGDAPDPFNAIDSGSVNNGVFTVSVNGLSPDTNYDAYVRSNCGGGDISSWTSATSFTTSIAAVVLSPGNIESEAYCYDSNEFKEWLFESSDGSPLQIEFLQGSVEVNTFSGGTYDDLIIYDGQDDTGTVLFNSDVDNVTAADLTGLTLTANSGFMYITLDSDISNSCASGAQTEIQFEVSIPQFASVQVIHNSADPAANLVDVYLNGTLLLDDFEFRTATPFVDVPAGSPIDIDIAPGTSTDVSDSIFNLNTTLTADETYVVVANGVLDPAQFDDSVNTIDFDLDVFAGAQQASTNAGETSLLINHGSPDAPMVDVVETTLPPSTLADNMSYPEFQGYVDVPTADYVLNVETADNATVVATYEAPLQTLGLGDQAISVLASGFLDPSLNQNGAAFGLWVALPAGGDLVELPFVEPEPAAPAPDPTEDSANVISMFSGVYTDVPVDTWLTSWSSAQLADIQIQGNDTKLYTDLDFAGAETVTNPIDASGMDFFHIDVWSPDATTFRVKLVDLGSNVEGEIAFSIAQEEWVSLQIPLTDFADPAVVTDSNNLLTATNSIQQVIISGLPVGAVTAYVDNVYFSSTTVGTTEFDSNNFSFYPNPTASELNFHTTSQVESVKVYNMLGQQVMAETPNTVSPSLKVEALQAGTYIMNVTINGLSENFRFIKE
ncbi:fibronectin type III domain-containing protein [Mesohalobacter halotolerans]|uniref:DUF4397 domain-containing protein n=1 Tax=Mesohalobacter halotolerans TaxID=1883405 RepID=A0A4U5TS55_9FLAO|nr:DUF4397 domain-containing protein [Mesohalobacter halotolerans]TKS56158.1 DUF4397 domain-containing protein [Mesohalobacter halotolerans]